MIMFGGEIVTLDVSLLSSEIMTPPAGAGFISVTASGATCPGSTVTLAASIKSGAAPTVTVALASGILGKALAWIVVVPGDLPVMVTLALVAFAANVTVPGTLAVPGFSEFRLTVKPPSGAGADKFNAKS